MADSKQYRPFADEDQTYPLAPTTTRKMRAIDMLRLESTIISDEQREKIGQEYCILEETDDGPHYGGFTPNSVPRDQFFVQAAKIVFVGADDAEEREVDFAEVRRALGEFESAGNERYEQLGAGLKDLVHSQIQKLQKTNTTES